MLYGLTLDRARVMLKVLYMTSSALPNLALLDHLQTGLAVEVCGVVEEITGKTERVSQLFRKKSTLKRIDITAFRLLQRMLPDRAVYDTGGTTAQEIPWLRTANINDQEVLSFIDKHAPDLVLLREKLDRSMLMKMDRLAFHHQIGYQQFRLIAYSLESFFPSFTEGRSPASGQSPKPARPYSFLGLSDYLRAKRILLMNSIHLQQVKAWLFFTSKPASLLFNSYYEV